jgi:hypothetical protein
MANFTSCLDLYHTLYKQCRKTSHQDSDWCHAINKQLLKRITICGPNGDYRDKNKTQVQSRLVDCSNMNWSLTRNCFGEGGDFNSCKLIVDKTMNSLTICKRIKTDHDKLLKL